MLDVFMASERETVEFLLERYPVRVQLESAFFVIFCRPNIIYFIYLFFQVLIYDGNFDLICNHVGVKKMIDAMENWSGKEKYYTTPQNVWKVGHF